MAPGRRPGAALRTIVAERWGWRAATRPRSPPKNDLFKRSGTWYTREEKAAVAAEQEYAELKGFWLKRLNYGSRADHIDA
jgi:hypothetical protein